MCYPKLQITWNQDTRPYTKYHIPLIYRFFHIRFKMISYILFMGYPFDIHYHISDRNQWQWSYYNSECLGIHQNINLGLVSQVAQILWWRNIETCQLNIPEDISELVRISIWSRFSTAFPSEKKVVSSRGW